MKGLYNTTSECEVTRNMDESTTYLSQTHYAEEILRTYNFWNATPRLTLMQPNTRLNNGYCDKNPAPDFHRRYCDIVSSLGYLSKMTRPDFAWAHPELSMYVRFLGKNHMLVTEHVLSYLTWNQTIRYSRDSHENLDVLWGWVDVDWAGDTGTRRSHTGEHHENIDMMNGSPISCKSRRQDNVALSTFEAEFVAAVQTGQEAIYLRETLPDFRYSQTKATLLYEDNLACIEQESGAPEIFSSHRHQTILCVRTRPSWGSQVSVIAQTKNRG